MHKMKRSFPQAGALLLVAALLLQGCKLDTTPDAFSFASQTNVAPDTLIESAPVTMTGITYQAPVSITGGEYSIDGGAYVDSAGKVEKHQKVRVRVRSSTESSGEVSATLTVGDVSATFTVKTANFTGRVEAEDASPVGGASTVADSAASSGEAVFIGSSGLGISIAESLGAQALIIAYRSDTAGALAVTVDGAEAGNFTLRPTGGGYATSSVVASVSAGDVVAISNPTAGSTTETYIDYVYFTDSPFKAVSTLAATSLATSDGTAVAANGDIYVSGGGGGRNVLRVTPDGEVSEFAAGFAYANGSDFDTSGNLYVADYGGNAVRKITPEGVMTTLASSLDGPAGVWVDQNGDVLVSLFGANGSGAGRAVLKITPAGVVSTYATGGGLQDVIGIVGDENGQVYASNWASGVIYNITGGNVAVLAQTGGTANHICYSNGFFYVPSPGDALIRRVSLDGVVETFTGTTTRQTIDGPLAVADFDRPNSCDFSPDGTILYVMDRGTGRLRKVDAGMP